MLTSPQLMKIVFIGSDSIGKTSLIHRFAEGTSLSNPPATIGIDFKNKTFKVDGSEVRLQIWDTAGQERFYVITQSYFKGARGIITMFDLTDQDSFHDVKRWLEDIKKHADENIYTMILGNKSDLKERRVVDQQMIQELIEEVKIPYLEVSAKTGENVEKAFLTIARHSKESSQTFKIIVVGGSLTGKTCIIHRLVEGDFPSQVSTTTRIDYKTKTAVVDGSKIGLQVWDTFGQEIGSDFINSYYQNVHGVIVVFDLTTQSSWKDLKIWLEHIQNNISDKKVCTMILGNKCDLQDKNVGDKQEIQELIKETKVPYCEVSAKTGANVEDAFTNMARRIKNNFFVRDIHVIGTCSCGKTYLINKLIDPNFSEVPAATKSFYFMRKMIMVEDLEIRFKVWETPSQQGFSSRNYKDVDGIIIVFDLTVKSSFDDVKQWIQHIKKCGGEKACKIIVGNKSDLRDQRAIDKQKIIDLIKEINIPYFEVSAQTGRNVEESFWCLAKDIKRTFIDKHDQESDVSECNIF